MVRCGCVVVRERMPDEKNRGLGARRAAHQASGVGRRMGKRIAGCVGEVRRRIKDVPFLEKGTKNPALASGYGFAGWKAAAGSHPHAARRSGKGRFVSGS